MKSKSMKYAVIPINRRIDEDGSRVVRRVLVRYEGVDRHGDFLGTKLVAKDDYFDNPASSHQYEFFDDGFALVKTNDAADAVLLGEKRRYSRRGYLVESPIEFKAKSDIEAFAAFFSVEKLNYGRPFAGKGQ